MNLTGSHQANTLQPQEQKMLGTAWAQVLGPDSPRLGGFLYFSAVLQGWSRNCLVEAS